ncbi:NBR1-Ig-like domain-containing protein [Thermoflexus hugenholtzii]
MMKRSFSLIVVAVLLMVLGIEGQRRALAQSGSGSSSSAVSRNISLIGNIGGIGGGLAVDGSRAYIGHGNHVLALDLSDPTSPREIGQSPLLPGFAWDIEIVGPYLYVATGLGGLRILDRATLREVGAYPTPSPLYDIAIQGEYAYLAEKEGLRIVDINNPTTPRLIHFMYTAMSPEKVSVSRNYVAISYVDHVEIYDFSQSINPIRVGQLSVPGWTRGIWFSNSWIFVLNCCTTDLSQQGLSVFDISNPSIPIRVSFLQIFAPEELVIRDQYAYIAAYTLYIVNISDPYHPQVITDGYGLSLRSLRKVQYYDKVVYVHDQDKFSLVSVVNPYLPQQLSSYILSGPKPGIFRGIYAIGSYAYLTDSEGFSIIDFSTPSMPRKRGFLSPSSGYFYRFSVDSNYAFVARSNYLDVIDISRPDNPTLIRSVVHNFGYMDAIDVKIWGNYVLVSSLGSCGSGVGLLIFERIFPDYPVHIASVPGTGRSFSVFVAASGSRVYTYVADACGMLHVVDTTNPAAPVRVASLNLFGTPYGVHVAGSYAYIAADQGGVLVVDVSNPTAPRLIHQYSIPRAFNVYVRGTYLYVASSKGLYILDISDPMNPRDFAYYNASAGSGADILFANDLYIFTADYRGGLNILRTISGSTEPINRPPIARIQMCYGGNCRQEGEQLEVEISSGQATLRLSGIESTDPDGDLLSYRWTVNGNPVGAGREILVSLGAGAHIVILTVEDGRGGKGEASGRIRVKISGSDGAQLKGHRGLISGSTVRPGDILVRIWHVKNIGTTTWDSSSYWIERVSGQIGPDRLSLSRSVNPGEEIAFVWQAPAPQASGYYTVSYRLRGPRGFFGPPLSLGFSVIQGDTGYGSTILGQANKLIGMNYSPTRAVTRTGGIVNSPTGYFLYESDIQEKYKKYYDALVRKYFGYGVCTDVVIDGTYFGFNTDFAQLTRFGARNADCLWSLLSGGFCYNKSLDQVLGPSYRSASWWRLKPTELAIYIRLMPGDLIFFKWKQGAFGERWDPNRETHHVGIVAEVTSDNKPSKILHNGGSKGLELINYDSLIGSSGQNVEWIHVVRIIRSSGTASLSAMTVGASQVEGEDSELANRLVVTLEGSGVTIEMWDGEGRFAPRALDPNVLAAHEEKAIPYIPGAEQGEIGGVHVITVTAPARLGTHYFVRLQAGSSTVYRLQARLMQGDQVLAMAEQSNPIETETLVVPIYLNQEAEGFRIQMSEPMPIAALILPGEEISGSGTSGVLRIQFPIQADPVKGVARKVRLSITTLRYGFFDFIPLERVRTLQEPVDLAPGAVMTGWIEVNIESLPSGSYVGRVIVSSDNAIPQSIPFRVEVQPKYYIYLPLVLREQR